MARIFKKRFPLCPHCGAAPPPYANNNFVMISVAYYDLDSYSIEEDWFYQGGWVDGAMDVEIVDPEFHCESCGNDFDDWLSITSQEDLEKIPEEFINNLPDYAIEKISDIISYNENLK
jgi:hypothetical protein